MNLEQPHIKHLRKLALFLASLILLCTITGLFIWLPVTEVPQSIKQVLGVPPHVTILFLLLITGLILAIYQHSKLSKTIGIVIATLGSALVLIAALLNNFNLKSDIIYSTAAEHVMAHTPLATGFSFILAGLILMTCRSYPREFINRFDSLLTTFILLPLLSVFSFIFNPNVKQVSHNLVTMPILTGIGFLLFFFSLILQVEGKGAAGILTRNSHSAKNFRALAFFVLIIPLCVGSVLTHAVEHKLLAAGFGAAIFCLFTTVLITISLVHNTILQEHWFKQLKKERKKSNLLQSQIHELLEISLDGIILFDDQSNILHANSGATKILGWNQDELQQMTIDDLISEKNLDEYNHFIKRFAHIDKQKSYEIPGKIDGLGKNGNEIPLTVTLSKKTTEKQTLMVAILKSMEGINQQLNVLEQKAKFDPLTKALNRLEFEEFCRNLEKHPPRKDDCKICTIVLDLDNFKNINDKYGHDAGDQALKACADAIRSTLRERDKLFRIGGEEFVVLAQNLTKNDALIFADRIRIAVKSKPIALSEQNIFITCSLGVCMADLNEFSMKVATKYADEAMYQAKQQGKDQVIIHE